MLLNYRFSCDNIDKIDDASSYETEGIYLCKMHKKSPAGLLIQQMYSNTVNVPALRALWNWPAKKRGCLRHYFCIWVNVNRDVNRGRGRLIHSFDATEYTTKFVSWGRSKSLIFARRDSTRFRWLFGDSARSSMTTALVDVCSWFVCTKRISSLTPHAHRTSI